jgi:hypothetical protein
MAHLDGVMFGSDQISSNPNIPLIYSASEWDGKPILSARDEYYQKKPSDYSEYTEPKPKPMVRPDRNPYKKRSRSESFRHGHGYGYGHRHGGGCPHCKSGNADIILIIILLVITSMLLTMGIKSYVEFQIFKDTILSKIDNIKL